MWKWRNIVASLFVGILILASMSATKAEDLNLPKTNGFELIWEKTYGGAGEDDAISLDEAHDYGFIIAGRTKDIQGYWDIQIVKTNESGTVEWEKTLGIPGHNEWTSGVRKISDGYIIVGTEGSGGASKIVLIKLDEEGNVTWQKKFGSSSTTDIGRHIQLTSDGGYIIAGGYGQEDWWNVDICLLKTDENGTIEWMKSYGDSTGGWDEAWSVRQTSDGGYIATGIWCDPWTRDTKIPRCFLLKTDSNGTKEWLRKYGDGTANESAIGYDVEIAEDDGFVVGGAHVIEMQQTPPQFWMLKTDKNGTEEWSYDYGEGGPAMAVRLHGNKYYVAAGTIEGGEGRYADVYVIKVDLDGNLVAAGQFGGSYPDFGYSMEYIGGMEFLIIGIYSHSLESIDAYILKVKHGENEPPDAPKIDGVTYGKAGKEYNYTFNATDPDGDDVLYYYIDWNDSTYEEWIGPYPSGTEVTVSHTWDQQGTYTIRAKAKDVYDTEGPWGTLEVTMPKASGFYAKNQIMMADPIGPENKNIEFIQHSDLVMSYDENTQPLIPAMVTQVYRYDEMGRP